MAALAQPRCAAEEVGTLRTPDRLLRPRSLQPAPLDAEVVDYLDTVDPAAAARARARYACFDHSAGDDGQAYGYAAAFEPDRAASARPSSSWLSCSATRSDT